MSGSGIMGLPIIGGLNNRRTIEEPGRPIAITFQQRVDPRQMLDVVIGNDTDRERDTDEGGRAEHVVSHAAVWQRSARRQGITVCTHWPLKQDEVWQRSIETQGAIVTTACGEALTFNEQSPKSAVPLA